MLPLGSDTAKRDLNVGAGLIAVEVLIAATFLSRYPGLPIEPMLAFVSVLRLRIGPLSILRLGSQEMLMLVRISASAMLVERRESVGGGILLGVGGSPQTLAGASAARPMATP
jgi:hypothetical protein